MKSDIDLDVWMLEDFCDVVVLKCGVHMYGDSAFGGADIKVAEKPECAGFQFTAIRAVLNCLGEWQISELVEGSSVGSLQAFPSSDALLGSHFLEVYFEAYGFRIVAAVVDEILYASSDCYYEVILLLRSGSAWHTCREWNV